MEADGIGSARDNEEDLEHMEEHKNNGGIWKKHIGEEAKVEIR